MDKQMQEFCKILPKIELHAHLNGSLSETTMKKLGCNCLSIEQYKKLTSLLYNRNERTLEHFFQLFHISHNLTSTTKSLYLATQDIIEDFFKDGTIYLELRTTPRSITDDEGNIKSSKSVYIETVIKAIQEHPSKGILVKLILSIDRSQLFDEKTIETMIEIKDRYPDIIVGVDLSGNPKVGQFNSDIFAILRQNGFNTTIHCAEVDNCDEIMAILQFKPDRIGHGTCILKNKDSKVQLRNWEMYKKLRIPLECCLTSNIVCATVRNYKEHHLGFWIENNLPFSIGTDDKGIFGTTLSEEYMHAGENFKLRPKDLWQISFNSIDYSFATSAEKEQLRSILNQFKNANEQYFS